ncbi:unnamed protein product [Kuraishia capsulata CBS 1993]|uniref:RING-type domain-containing protein n=1 Tax=Kuraishia capsulata CBS 1993 TaxID=1382522 RepID=W6MIZ9_9ASCO|nr:uncharacterized protein KUCA_T00000339001 [Kuraishia capsulata CBS 1993]CDK24377.1 unnamed protein product [Kuraishia capsulata CBS 1993]
MTENAAEEASGFDVVSEQPSTMDMRSLQYVDPLDHLTCPICQLPFITPFQTKCGHIFCKSCILETFRSPIGQKCPLDRSPLHYKEETDGEANIEEDESAETSTETPKTRENDIFPAPIIISNITDDMRVRCLNLDRGCEWIGPRWSIKTHLLLDCGFTRFECNNELDEEPISICKKLTQRRYLDGLNSCPHKEYGCQFCGEMITKPDEEKHFTKECDKNLKKCKGCLLEFPLKSVEHHERFCDKFVEKCPAASIGCDWKGARELLTLHQETCIFTRLKPILDEKDKTIGQLRESTSFLSSKLEIILDSIVQGKVTNVGFPLQLDEVSSYSGQRSKRDSEEDYVHLLMELEGLRSDFMRIQPSISALEAQQQMISGLVAQNTHLMEDMNNQRMGLNSVRQQIQFLLMDRRPRGGMMESLMPRNSVPSVAATVSKESLSDDEGSSAGRSNKL